MHTPTRDACASAYRNMLMQGNRSNEMHASNAVEISRGKFAFLVDLTETGSLDARYGARNLHMQDRSSDKLLKPLLTH